MVKANIGRTAKHIILIFSVTILCILSIFPFFWTIVTALKPIAELFLSPPTFFQSSPQFKNFGLVFTKTPMILWLKNTIIFAAGTFPCVIFLSVLAGYALSRYRFRGRSLTAHMILLTQMLPWPLIIIAIYMIFSDLSLTDTFFGLILIQTAVTAPVGTWVLKGFFDNIPKALEEAALVDGCTRIGALFRITVPLSLPGIFSVAMLTVLWSWHSFVFPLTLISDPSKIVLSVGLRFFINQYSIQWNMILSASIIATVLPVLFFIFLEKRFVRGLTGGALK